uniref:NADH-ubiquinone oxidoreductase chain 2 n=2 Tax=Christinus marmoratus TaxID=221556 RepID=J7G8U7_9SAUR|nr:NADH dehydrogenase subunit 2 [Christinus marmoratus]AIM44954.1 NADH dehydrogenase subunit 2 [Christinus marmoratus]
MSPLIWTILITSLSTSTIITMMSHHWLLAWLGLELNTLSMLPIIMKTKHPRATEAATKYFIIQATAAAMILFASTMNVWQTGQWLITYPNSPTATTITTLALMLKLGLAPMHFWYPEVLQGVTMNTAMVISTWQKIAPMTLLFLMTSKLPTNTIIMIGLTSALLGGWMGLNQTQTRKILAFSSISHMGWLVIALTMNQNLTTLTFMVYAIMTITMFTSLNTTTSKTLTDLGTNWTYSPMLLLATMMTLMSLGGLPPLTGFMPKWLILKELTLTELIPLSITIALASLPSLFFYIRMTYLAMLTMPPHTTSTEHKWRFKNTSPKSMPSTITLTTLLLPITPMLYNTL